jgi:hypothetical protein
MAPHNPVELVRRLANGLFQSAGNRIQVEDENGNVVNAANPLPVSGGGAGGAVEVVQATHDDLNANANMQIGDADVSDTNLVPVKGIGETIALLASAARTATAGTNGAAFPVTTRVLFAILLEFTNKADDVDDTCDVYIDMLLGATWINAVHFTRVLGNAADASKEYALLMPSAGTAPITATADAGSGVIRPEVIGSQIRARWIIVDPSGADATFTFSVTVWAM